jgi:hypothetical protein
VTGSWSGVYSYAMAADEFFMAELVDAGGLVTGTITETPRLVPDTPTLRAGVVGNRNGDKITFLKRYDGTGGWSHTVRYSGRLSADGLEIGGSWRLEGFHGSFLMVRSAAPGTEATVDEAATTRT